MTVSYENSKAICAVIKPAGSIAHFPNRTRMHGAGKLGLVSRTNLDQLLATGALVVAAPLRIVDGSGSPLRVVAFIKG